MGKESSKLKSKVFVRHVKEADCDDIFIWRNNETTRNMSLSSDILLYEEHMKWFKKILADPNEVFLFFEDSLVKLKLGIVRFELNMDKGTGLVSINLSPESRGKSYAKPCLNAAIKELRMNFHSCHTLFAEIKNDNIPSLRSFEGIGFKLDKNGNDFLTYKLKL